MAKLNKHAEIIDQLHNMVKKQAEGQSTIVGTPGADTKPEKTPESTEHIDKNKVTPLENKQEVVQDKSKEEAGKVVSDAAAKTAADLPDLSTEILNLLKKRAEAESTIVGTPGGDTKPASPSPATEHIDKNTVKPEDNKQEVVQEKSKEDAGKVVSDAAAKTAAVVETPVEDKTASKIASYNLGASLIADLVKESSVDKSPEKAAFAKEAGRKDMDTLISQISEQIKVSSPTIQPVAPVVEQEKVSAEVAEKAGAAFFDELYKNASDSLLVEKVANLTQELNVLKEASSADALARQASLDKEAAEKREEALVLKFASTTAELLKQQLKSEPAK